MHDDEDRNAFPPDRPQRAKRARTDLGGTAARSAAEGGHQTVHTAHPNSATGLRAYTQKWTYDPTGNLTQWQHLAGISNAAGWTRDYTYAPGTNRLATTSHTAGTKNYTHDAHGNITAMPHLSAIDWDYADRMRHVEVTTGQDVYFNDDAAGQRVRKVWITNAGTWRRERIYLGGYEVWRKYNLVGGSWVLQDERETVHISDDQRRICMVETLTVEGSAVPSPVTPRLRFQFDDHLGTAGVETDQTGAIISMEEFHPYGTSSYRSWTGGVEVSAKRYRYTGKERDEETSLYYHGARYYAPWLGRWMSADPAGTVDGTNLFAYVRGSPVVMSDPSGTQSASDYRVPQTGIHSVGYEGRSEPEADRSYQFAPVHIEASYARAVQRTAWRDLEKAQAERGGQEAKVEDEFKAVSARLAGADVRQWIRTDPAVQAREKIEGLRPGHVAALLGAPAAAVGAGAAMVGTAPVVAAVPSWVWAGAALGTLATGGSSHQGPGVAAHFRAAALATGMWRTGNPVAKEAAGQEQGPIALLPELSATTELQMQQIIAESNPKFPLSETNALRAVTGPPGSRIARLAEGPGADLTFESLTESGVATLQREVKSIAGGAQGSFNTEVAHAAKQVDFGGEILVQVPEGTDALRMVLRFRGPRTAAQLGRYRSVEITIVDPEGRVLFAGPLVP
ncbi:MAG: RHS repeat-associated core domain-containing protein [Polyangiaceae bacterium]